MEQHNYDLAVSYASEQRDYVEIFVRDLKAHGLRIYYDQDEQKRMVGKILDKELHQIYIKESHRCLLFFSKDYVEKPVTKFESNVILSESMFQDEFMYIFKFDDVAIPGLNRNFIYSSFSDFPNPNQFADFMYEVISGKTVSNESEKSLFDEIFKATRKCLDIYANRYGMQLIVDQQLNKTTCHLSVSEKTILQFQLAIIPGRSDVYIWMHNGEFPHDEHAYQGHAYWAEYEGAYILENRALLRELSPHLIYPSLRELTDRLESRLKELVGV